MSNERKYFNVVKRKSKKKEGDTFSFCAYIPMLDGSRKGKYFSGQNYKDAKASAIGWSYREGCKLWGAHLWNYIVKHPYFIRRLTSPDHAVSVYKKANRCSGESYSIRVEWRHDGQSKAVQFAVGDNERLAWHKANVYAAQVRAELCHLQLNLPDFTFELDV